MVAKLAFALLLLPQLCSCSATYRALLGKDDEADKNDTDTYDFEEVTSTTTTTTTMASSPMSAVRMSGSMVISVPENSSGLLSDVSAMKAVGDAFAGMLGDSIRKFTVSLPQDETRRLAAQNVSLVYTIEVEAESVEAAQTLAEGLKARMESLPLESLTNLINTKFQELGLDYSLTVIDWVPPGEIETITDGSGSSSSGDEEDDGSVMQSQWCIFTMLLLLVIKMD